jgi:hypothetical protein
LAITDAGSKQVAAKPAVAINATDGFNLKSFIFFSSKFR